MSASTSATGSQADRQGDRAPQPAAPPAPWLSLTPDDGWLTLVLLAAVVFFTVSSIQSVTPPWAPGLQILTMTTAVGLLLGFLVVQQGRIPPSVVHSLAILLGVAFAVNQTAAAVLGDDWKLLLSRMASWFRLAFLGGRGSTDNAVFLLFLGILTFLLAYISYWLVVQTRRPWLAVLANGTVLLINLNWGTDNLVIFLVLFLLASMLLLVRFTLAENMRHWRARGLRFSPDLSWDFMQAGAILAVVVLLLAYILPVGTANADVLRALNDPQGAWQKAQGRFELLFGGLVGPKGTGGGGGGLFGPSIHLVGKVDLPDIPILHYTVEGTGDASQYLVAQTLDSYDGVNAWTQSQSQQHPYGPGVAQPASGADNVTNSYTVTFDLTDGDGQHTLVVPGSEAESFSVPTFSYFSLAANMPTSWEAQRPMQRGESYVATGYASHASEAQLRAVLSPAQAAKRGPNDPNAYDPELLAEYVGNEGSISPEIRQTALVATKGTTNMYDAALALEDYLRSGFTYSTNNPEPPPDQDATVWFLNQKKGYCTFFASAMALMGRSLGMPTRVASGFISGAYDQKSNTYVVKGTASHAWTQVYFAGYGWVNFEPTASFEQFIRPISTTQTPTPTGSTTPGASGTPRTTPTPRDGLEVNPGSGGGGGDTGAFRATLGGSALLLLLLLAAAFALIWWRLLFRGLSPAAAAFGRITRLGTWAGASPGRAQTPLEYAEQLSEVTPAQRGAIRQLGTAYSRERYGGGVPPDLARQVPSLYDQVRGALARVITRRAYGAPLALLRRVGLGRRGGSDDAT